MSQPSQLAPNAYHMDHTAVHASCTNGSQGSFISAVAMIQMM